MDKLKYVFIIGLLIFISYIFYEVFYYEEIYISSNNNINLIEIKLEGAVYRPGIFIIREDTTYRELITYAGGFTEDAEQSLISLDNYVDKTYIYVNYKDYKKDDNTNNDDLKLNLNNATFAQLLLIPGITENRANEIINYRNLNQKFITVEDLLKVKGIGVVTFENIKNYFTV